MLVRLSITNVRKNLFSKKIFRAKKLVLVLATFASITKTNKKNSMTLAKILYIYYLLRFHKDKKNAKLN